MPVVSPACCGTVWYCTPIGPVEAPVGTAPPTGFTAGPVATMAELGSCPVPPVPDLVLTCCATNPAMPSRLWLSLESVTGWMIGRLPNSVVVIVGQPSIFPGLIAYGTTSVVDSGGETWNWNVGIYCNPAGNPTGWRVGVSFAPSNSLYLSAGAAWGNTIVAPWADTVPPQAMAAYQDFTCLASWALAVQESIADITFSTTALGASSFRLVVSR